MTTPASPVAMLGDASMPLHLPAAEPSLMGMPEITERWTALQVRALPDDGLRYEAVDGVLLVTPAPSLPHQVGVQSLFEKLRAYVPVQKLGYVFFSPADIELDPHTLVQPDLFVAPLIDGRRPRSWTEITTLLLAVEVLSPSSARYDRQLKRRRYQRAAFPEYWIVDLDSRLLERWRPQDERPEVLTERIEWRPAGAAEAMVIDLTAFFEEVLVGDRGHPERSEGPA